MTKQQDGDGGPAFPVAPHDFKALMDAESHGSHFIANFAKQPEKFPYSKYDEAVHGPVEIEGE